MTDEIIRITFGSHFLKSDVPNTTRTSKNVDTYLYDVIAMMPTLEKKLPKQYNKVLLCCIVFDIIKNPLESQIRKKYSTYMSALSKKKKNEI